MKTMINILAVAAVAGISIMGTTADACSKCATHKKMEKKECPAGCKKECCAKKKKASAEKKKCSGCKKK